MAGGLLFFMGPGHNKVPALQKLWNLLRIVILFKLMQWTP